MNNFKKQLLEIKKILHRQELERKVKEQIELNRQKEKQELEALKNKIIKEKNKMNDLIKVCFSILNNSHWNFKDCEGCIKNCPGWIQERKLNNKVLNICKDYTFSLGGDKKNGN